MAHHPTGTQPSSGDVVIAHVHTRDEERVLELGREFDLWSYVSRQGYAVIRADRSRLPEDAVIVFELGDERQRTTEPYRGSGTIPARDCYRTVEQTYADLAALESANSQIAQWSDFGDSWEKTEGLGGYDLRALVLTNQSIPGPKPVFMVIAASHARELATAEAVTRFAQLLFAGYGTDANITWMLDYFEVHVVAQHNPDGRKMAEGECVGGCFPQWRKNTNDDYCVAKPNDRGADLNRNASGSFWGGIYSSGDECNTLYRGASAASEPETTDLEAYAIANFPDFRTAAPDDFITPADENAHGMFISVHSSGEIIFYPWEGINDPPPNLTGLRSMAQKLGHATGYDACQNCWLGPASGTNVDFAYEQLGIPSFTFEIGTSFGQSCESFEASVLPETINGLMSALRHTRESYQSPLGPDISSLSWSPAGSGGILAATADDTQRAINSAPGESLEPSQAIASVKYSVGEPPWLAKELHDMDASDGTFDATLEDAEAYIAYGDYSGTQLIFVTAQDASGAWGPPSAIWVNLDAVFGSGFEGP